MFRKDRHAERECGRPKAFAVELVLQLAGMSGDPFRALVGTARFASGRTMMNSSPPITAGNIFPTDLAVQQLAQFTQHLVASGMAPGVVEVLEIIHIQHDDAQWKLFAFCSQQLTLQRLLPYNAG